MSLPANISGTSPHQHYAVCPSFTWTFQQWRDACQICEGSALHAGLAVVFVILVVEWIVFLVLAVYLEQVLASGTGVRRYPLFFLPSWKSKRGVSAQAVFSSHGSCPLHCTHCFYIKQNMDMHLATVDSLCRLVDEVCAALVCYKGQFSKHAMNQNCVSLVFSIPCSSRNSIKATLRLYSTGGSRTDA